MRSDAPEREYIKMIYIMLAWTFVNDHHHDREPLLPCNCAGCPSNPKDYLSVDCAYFSILKFFNSLYVVSEHTLVQTKSCVPALTNVGVGRQQRHPNDAYAAMLH